MYDPTKPYKHEILRLVAQTWKTPYVVITPGIYSYIEKKFTGIEVQHTDGIGTKGVCHWQRRTFKNAVLDALAMNLNDLAMAGATPYAIQNHITLPEDDHAAVLEIVKALATECKKRRIALTGGETSVHADSEGMDISITVSGFAARPRENIAKAGDVLVGLRSAGLHSNGITKAREVFKKIHRKELVEPTRIYADDLAKLKPKQVNGMMHITGGAFTKLRDILKGTDAHIVHPRQLKPQKIFFDLRKKVSNADMYTTFNCGIGFVLSVPEREVKSVLRRLPGSAAIGRVIEGTGKVRIISGFDKKAITL